MATGTAFTAGFAFGLDLDFGVAFRSGIGLAAVFDVEAEDRVTMTISLYYINNC